MLSKKNELAHGACSLFGSVNQCVNQEGLSSVAPLRHRLPQPLHQRRMPLDRLDDAHIRQPVAHYGQQLVDVVDVVDVGGHQKRAICICPVLLLGQYLATG